MMPALAEETGGLSSVVVRSKRSGSSRGPAKRRRAFLATYELLNISCSRADVSCRSAESAPARGVQPANPNIFFEAVPLCRLFLFADSSLLQVPMQRLPGSPGDTPPWQPAEDPAWGCGCPKTLAQQWLERRQKIRQREQRLQQQLDAQSAEMPPGPPESQVWKCVLRGAGGRLGLKRQQASDTVSCACASEIWAKAHGTRAGISPRPARASPCRHAAVGRSRGVPTGTRMPRAGRSAKNPRGFAAGAESHRGLADADRPGGAVRVVHPGVHGGGGDCRGLAAAGRGGATGWIQAGAAGLVRRCRGPLEPRLALARAGGAG